MLFFKQISIIASKEFYDRIRNKWILVITGVFMVFSFVITYFGMVSQGDVGLQSSIETTVMSLVSLVIYLIPLIALILGFDAVIGEKERGSFDLLLSLPITRAEFLLGKYIGLALALTVSILLGFGMMGIVLSFSISFTDLFHYIGFIISAIFLGLVFLSLALLISVVSSDRAQASGIAILLWFFFVLIFDLLLLGILVITNGSFAGNFLPYILLLNPIDIFRILNIFSDESFRILSGINSIFPDSLSNPFYLGLIMFIWIVIPLILSLWRLNKCE